MNNQLTQLPAQLPDDYLFLIGICKEPDMHNVQPKASSRVSTKLKLLAYAFIPIQYLRVQRSEV
jgi:hypothetical protein